ncbi:hypothetical protein G7K_0338-t2 [Saitoella complicata NRRL Y-17804]|uniref:Uncharacterized protein n=1 Tax=Saitoella complicata (strain BCRC 22490 / CBS 7301 / JCM 7358 / NBRC 10748 / NRRL Y-17804) TaxID=698492 RepID=A0A0E9N8H2_SAICN|nr:hypothetical protein G7K_0338-t2 [Saitoella complicata NRRL Y-17804]
MVRYRNSYNCRDGLGFAARPISCDISAIPTTIETREPIRHLYIRPFSALCLSPRPTCRHLQVLQLVQTLNSEHDTFNSTYNMVVGGQRGGKWKARATRQYRIKHGIPPPPRPGQQAVPEDDWEGSSDDDDAPNAEGQKTGGTLDPLPGEERKDVKSDDEDEDEGKTFSRRRKMQSNAWRYEEEEVDPRLEPEELEPEPDYAHLPARELNLVNSEEGPCVHSDDDHEDIPGLPKAKRKPKVLYVKREDYAELRSNIDKANAARAFKERYGAKPTLARTRAKTTADGYEKGEGAEVEDIDAFLKGLDVNDDMKTARNMASKERGSVPAALSGATLSNNLGAIHVKKGMGSCSACTTLQLCAKFPPLVEDWRSPTPADAIRREKRPKTIIEVPDEDAKIDHESPFTVDPLKKWIDVKPFLLEAAVEELRQDRTIKEGMNIHSLTPEVTFKVVLGRAQDSLVSTTDRNNTNIKWSAFNEIDTGSINTGLIKETFFEVYEVPGKAQQTCF